MISELTVPPVASSSEADDGRRLRGMVNDHFDAVWRGLKRLGVPEAQVDDAAQQVFLVASKKLPSIDVGGERRYLLGVALRIASDARRALRRRREVPFDGVVELAARGPEALPDEVLDDKRACALLVSVLDGMPGELREAFVLFELEQFTAVEVAEMLGIPLGTVGSRVRRAREIVRGRLADRRGPK